MKRKFFNVFLYLALILVLDYTSASYAKDVDQVINNILDPVSAFTDAFYKISYALGFLLIAGSVVQYNMHRKNPVQVKLSNVICLLIIGIVVFCLPFIVKLSSSSKTIDKALQRQQSQVQVPQPAAPPVQPNPTPANDTNWYNSP